MTTLHSTPKIQKQSISLSKLTKGVAEFTSNQEKRLEILLDDSDVLSEKSGGDILPNRSKTVIGISNSSSNLRQEINLPKTYTTKKGALLLFSEEILANKKEKSFSERSQTEENLNSSTKEKLTFDSDSLSDMPMRTVNDLQRNILFYGMPSESEIGTNKTNVPLKEITNDLPVNNTENVNDSSIFSFVSTKNLVFNNKNQFDQNGDNSKIKKINRGYSARRYVRNLTKNWDQDLLDTFISDGKINHETVYEKTESSMNAPKKRRVDDDLTIWPQAYKFEETWIAATVDMRSYKFLKAQDFNLNKTFQDDKLKNSETTLKKAVKYNDENNLPEFKSQEEKSTKINFINPDPIKIFDQKSNEIAYKSLNMNEKQRVLSELLFNSALKNMKKNRIIDYDENEASELIESSQELAEQNAKNEEKILTNETISMNNTEPVNIPEQNSQIKLDSKRKADLNYNSVKPMQPIYMFGKSSGAPWIKPNRAINEILNPKPQQLVSETSFAKLKLGTVTPQLPDEKSFIQSGASSETNRLTRSRSLIRKQLISSSPIRNSQLDSKASTSLFVSTASARQSNEKSYNDNLIYNEDKMVQEVFNQDMENLALIKVDEDNDLDKFYSTGHLIDDNENLTNQEALFEELRSQKSGFALEEETKISLKTSFNKIDEFDENADKKIERKKLENGLNMQLLEESSENLINGSTNSLESSSVMSRSDKKKKERKKEKESRKKARKESQTESYIKKLTSQRIEFEKMKAENNKVENTKIGNTNFAAFDVLKRFEKPKKNIELTFSESKEKLYVSKLKKEDEIETKRMMSPSPAFMSLNTTESSTDLVKENSILKSNPFSSNYQVVETSIIRDKHKDKLNRPIKPSFNNDSVEVSSEHSENKISLPKLKPKQNFKLNNKQDDKELGKKSPTEKVNMSTNENKEKETKDIGASLINFDDDYVQVSQLKPKIDSVEKLNKKTNSTSADVKLTFLSQNADEKYSIKINNYIKENHDKNDKETEPKRWFDLKKAESNPAPAPTLKVNNFGANVKEADTYKESAFLPKAKPNPPTNTNKRTVNWSLGDFDPREFFVTWSYEPPLPPVVVDKKFADSLKRYAELMARLVLGKKGAGMNLSEDVRRALRENLDKLRDAIARGEIDKQALNEYKNVFKNILAKVLKRKDLENLEIDDDMLMKLLELPPDAFEIYTDPVDGKEKLRIKSSYLREQAKLVREVVTEKMLSMNDFDVEIDPVTGEKKLKLKADVAKKLGIPDGAEDMIEFYTDENGNQVMRLKNGAKTITIGDTVYELVIDPTTGQTVLKMTTKQKVGKETIEDIMRLAANMSPETRHRYFQELLKTSGDKLSDELRRQIINEMIQNANNLDPEIRDNLLKDLVKDLINVLPPDLAKKVLDDIMKATDNLDVGLKEQMIKNLLENLDELPPELKESTLKVLIQNIDNLSSEAKHALLQDILNKVEEMGVNLDENSDFKDLRNEILKEMIKNSQNLDEETRNKIIQQVMEKLAEDGGGDIPSVILEELVKQMNNMPDSIKNKIMDEIQKNLEKGELDSNVLAALLANADELSPEILAAIVKNSDKMDANTLKELVKNLDKLPDDLKEEMINKMVANLEEMDNSVKQQLLKELFTNPDLIKDEALREKVMREIMGNMTAEDIERDTANMTAEEKNIYLQNLLKRAGDLSEEARQKIISELLKNAENLDEETRENLLRNLVENVVKDLPPELAAKVLSEIMKNTENLDASLKQKMIESLLNNMDNLPPELKQQTLQEIIKNLDDLSAEKKEEIFKNILQNIDSLPTELRDQTLKTIINNMENLSSDAKNQLLQNILDKVEANGENSEFSKKLRNEVLKEIIKNSQNLDETERQKILNNVMGKLKEGGEVPDELLDELYKQMNDLPDEMKNVVLNQIKKNIEKGKISAEVLDNILKNSGNVPLEVLEKVVDNIKKMETNALKKLVKNLDSLPDNLKTKAIQEMINNIENLDPGVQRELLKEILKNPKLIKDQKVIDKAIMDIIQNLDKLPENMRKDMLKDIAKNINNLSQDVKKQVMKEVFNNLKGSTEETRGEVLKQLLKKMGKEELEEWIRNSDLSDELKAKMLAEIDKMIESGDVYLDSDDEDELIGLTGEERARKRRQLIDKKKEQMGNIFTSELPKEKLKETKRDLSWLKMKKEKVLSTLKKDPNETGLNLNEDQIDFIKAFNQLNDFEKAKLLESLTDEERQNLMQLRNDFEKLRQKELQDSLIEARNLAIEKMRQTLALRKRAEYMDFLRIEWNMLDHSQQLSRAFVFSYLELLQGLEVQTILELGL